MHLYVIVCVCLHMQLSKKILSHMFGVERMLKCRPYCAGSHIMFMYI